MIALDGPRVVSVEAALAPATILRLDDAAYRAAGRQGAKLRVTGFPLNDRQTVELELQPFSVVSPDTRFVIGDLNGPDRVFPYDATKLSFFRGRVVGEPGSHVYLSLSADSSTGYIDLGPGRPRHRISSKGAGGQALGRGLASVFRTTGAAAAPAGVPLCGVEGDKLFSRGAWSPSPVPPRDIATTSAAAFTVGLKQMELAVETDYELYTLFDDATATMDYVVQMYGEVSAIFMRDVDTRIEVVFVRVWDNPNDLFNGPDPLFQFYPYWLANMQAVSRDAVQFFSGRRDFPFGGQAFVSQLCAFSFGIVGYAVGSFPDPSTPDPFNWDVPVTAHELGHTAGTGHTHGNLLDTCDDPATTPQRGPIMSYCGQTWSGMKANTDNYFHRVSQSFMDSHISGSACIVADCNMNNIDDAIDITGPTSQDMNGNGVPDECEDCNNNGTLDSADIAGASNDLNGNGVPDECEPDCNGNNVPDDRDILLGTSLDAFGNDIPDECETDCNNNGVSDYTEIQADITLDKDRNAALDACQDCDADGTSDLVELNGGHHLWVATGLGAEVIRQFITSVGVLTKASGGGGAASVNQGQDLIVAPDGRILVTSATDNRVMLFNPSGNYAGDFIAPGAGGLSYPTGLIMAPSGRLLVSSRDTHSVLAYDGLTGAPQGAFVSSGSGGLVRPFGLTYGPNGNLFVTSDDNRVLEFDGGSGVFIGEFVTAGGNGGLSQPRGLAFKPDGNLLVANYGTDEVLEYDRETGWPRGKWAKVGTATRITQDSPWGIRVGPNGNVFVSRTGTAFSSPSSADDNVAESHLTDARMFEYDVCTGDFRKTEITA
ncbi:MAG: M12 family metallo-peptidase [Phycisphaerae bacterium]